MITTAGTTTNAGDMRAIATTVPAGMKIVGTATATKSITTETTATATGIAIATTVQAGMKIVGTATAMTSITTGTTATATGIAIMMITASTTTTTDSVGY